MSTVSLTDLINDIREQVLFLQELGVDSLAVELPEVPFYSVDGDKWIVDSGKPRPIELPAPVAKAPPPASLNIPKREIEAPKQTGSRLSALPSLSARPKKSLSGPPSGPGGPPGPDRGVPPEAEMMKSIPADEPLIEVSPKLAETSDTIETIRAEIGDCTRCPLHERRTQVVHTTGNFEADLMFIGEAPGADEDEQGFPFVGRAGQLLTKIIEGIGYRREDVAIGNINRCRPPGNRPPTLPEAHTCRPFLLREIAVIKPKVIVVMGNTALHNLLDTKVGITKVRGSFQDYFGVKVMPTFHPAYLLRDPNKKREVWEDMKKVRDYLAEREGSIPDLTH